VATQYQICDTHIPFDTAEELAVTVISLSQIIGCNENLPTCTLCAYAGLGLEQILTQTRPFFLASVVRHNRYVWRELFELA
jgi:hypothetical protein